MSETILFPIVGESGQTLRVAGGYSYIFSFSASDFRRTQEIGIDLLCKDVIVRKVVLTPSDDTPNNQARIKVWSGSHLACVAQLQLGKDANIVVRVVRSSKKSLTMFVNGVLLAASETVTKAAKIHISKARVAVKTKNSGSVVVTLDVFSKKSTSSGLAEAFASKMRHDLRSSSSKPKTIEESVGSQYYLRSSSSKPMTIEDSVGRADGGNHVEEAKETEETPPETDHAHLTEVREQAVAESDEANVDRGRESEKVVEEAKEQVLAELGKDLAVNQKAVEELEKAMTDLRSVVADHQEEMEANEKEMADLKRFIEDFEKAIEERAKAAEQKQDHGFRGGASGDADIKPSSSLNVNPPDADLIKVSVTVAWPRAIRHVLGADLANQLQQTHDTMMSDWVVARGDNLSSNTYDFLVYSHGVAWPKVVLETTAEPYITKIWERHGFIMEALV